MLRLNHLEPTVLKKIQNIVEKLQKLDCTLLGNKDDAWIMELLFQPGIHRYNLIEWILSKLDIGNISGPRISEEETLRNLQSTVSDLGICRPNSHDIVKGTATLKEQLVFWCHLVDVIWLQYELSLNSSMTEVDEGIALSLENSRRKCISEEFDEAYFCINKICESVKIKNLFKRDAQLLAPDVERELQNISPSRSDMHKIPNLQEFKELAKEKNMYNNLLDQYRILLLNKLSIEENEKDSDLNVELKQSEEELQAAAVDFQIIANGSFNSVYNHLEPLMSQAKPEEFTDVGPAFKKFEPLLGSFLQLKKSFLQLDSANSKFLKTSSDLDELISQETLHDKRYTDILKMVKDED